MVRRMGFIHHRNHAAGDQHALGFLQKAGHVRNVMEHVRKQERSHRSVAEGQGTAVQRKVDVARRNIGGDNIPPEFA